MVGARISVIIVAHDRRVFLLQAVNSVLNQSLSRELFEVLVIKNFTDKRIDAFLHDNGVKSHLCENIPVGSKYALGATESTNEVLCFLEDDDQYRPDKLEFVLDKFSSDPDLGYLRHGYIPIGSEGNALFDKNPDINDRMEFKPPYTEDKLVEMLKFRVGDLSSCICMRKSLLSDSINLLNKISAVPDKFFLISSLSDNYKIYSLGDKMTLYRIHESMSNTFLSPENSLTREKGYLEASIKDYSEIMKLAGAQKIKSALQNILNNNQQIIFLLDGGVVRSLPLQKTICRLMYLRNKFFDKNNVILALFSALYMVSPDIASRFYTKIRITFHTRRLANSRNHPDTFA